MLKLFKYRNKLNFSIRNKKRKFRFSESKLAHKYLDGLSGLEIGGSFHNPFGLNTKNVDCCDIKNNIFKNKEKEICGEILAVDIIASGDAIPVQDESQDFVISSHVLEHFYDPIKALKEWYRVIKKGGYIFMIVPHKKRCFDKNRERTTLKELLNRHSRCSFIKNTLKISEQESEKHHSVWITEDVVELVNYLEWKIVKVQDIDDKVGNGFIVVIQKNKFY